MGGIAHGLKDPLDVGAAQCGGRDVPSGLEVEGGDRIAVTWLPF